MELANETERRKLKGNPVAVLKKLKFITGGKPTWAAILLFGKDPNGFLLQAKVKCGRFKTPSDILDDNVIEGTLLEQVDSTIKAIRKNIHVRYEIKTIRRKEIWDYPLDALREAVLNAICHRDYTSNSFTTIKIFDDHIHIWNPGRLVGNLTVEELLKGMHESEPRNKLIAQYFFDIGEIEQYGSGIYRMINACKKAGLPSPVIEESQGGFALTFKMSKIKHEGEDQSYVYASGDEGEIINRQEKTVVYIRKKGRITNSEYQKLFGVSHRTASRELSEWTKKKFLKRKGTTGRGTSYVLAGV